MSINLRPETEQRIQARINAGTYSSADDVVDAGLKLLEQREQQKQKDLESVRRKLAIGLEEIERGDVVDGEEFFQKMLAELDGEGEPA